MIYELNYTLLYEVKSSNDVEILKFLTRVWIVDLLSLEGGGGMPLARGRRTMRPTFPIRVFKALPPAAPNGRRQSLYRLVFDGDASIIE